MFYIVRRRNVRTYVSWSNRRLDQKSNREFPICWQWPGTRFFLCIVRYRHVREEFHLTSLFLKWRRLSYQTIMVFVSFEERSDDQNKNDWSHAPDLHFTEPYHSYLLTNYVGGKPRIFVHSSTHTIYYINPRDRPP